MDGTTVRGPWLAITPELNEHINDQVRTKRRPEDLTGLATSKPAKTLGWDPVREYDVNPGPGRDRDKIKCPICNRQIHWHGAVFRFSDGWLRLIGWDCMGLHYGEATVARRRQQFRTEQAREQLVETMRTVLEALPAARQDAFTLHACDTASAAVQLHGLIRRAMGEALDRAYGHARDNGGSLTLQVERADQAFDARVGGVTRGTAGSQYRELRHPYLGAEATIDGAGLRRVGILKGAERLAELGAELRGLDLAALSLAKLRGCGAELLKACDGILHGRNFLIELGRWMGDANLMALCRWLDTVQLTDGAEIRWNVGTVEVLRNRADPVRIRPARPYKVPGAKDVRRLRQLLTGGRLTPGEPVAF